MKEGIQGLAGRVSGYLGDHGICYDRSCDRCDLLAFLTEERQRTPLQARYRFVLRPCSTIVLQPIWVLHYRRHLCFGGWQVEVEEHGRVIAVLPHHLANYVQPGRVLLKPLVVRRLIQPHIDWQCPPLGDARALMPRTIREHDS